MPTRPAQYNRGNIYLSGGMQFAEDLGGGWRQQIADRLRDLRYYPIDITALDRMYAAQHGELRGVDSDADRLETKANVRLHFVDTDLRLVAEQTDAVVVLMDEAARRGGGTHAEVQCAYDNNIPVFLVCEDPDWETHLPAWTQALVTRICPSFDLLIQYMDYLPPSILIKDQYGNHHDRHGNYLCSLCGDVFHKYGHHFVSLVQPLYCKRCVNIAAAANEGKPSRYDFMLNIMLQDVAG